jgi:hypothetical protein
MEVKFISKNKVGYFAALFLVVLLSQSRVFNFLIDTFLGRSLLILFILLIAYTNQILGTVVVFIIIIIFSGTNIGYLEGFGTDASGNGLEEPSEKDKKQSPLDNTESNATIPATEGFDISSKERYIQNGKQSNQIPVNDSMRITKNVLPFESGILTPY